MAKEIGPAIEVTCPCCQSKLTVDPQLAVVLAHTPPPRVAPDVDISDAARILSEQAQRRARRQRRGCRGGGGGISRAGGAWLIGRLVPALPTHTAWSFVLLAEVIAVLIGLAAGVLPALKAAGLDPVAALRDE